jgi:hypothetical protein
MSDMPQEQPAASVRAIDLLAHAVFTWVRHETMGQRFRGNPVGADEQSALAAGFIAGLRTRIGLSDSEAALVAYVYALMSGERKDAAGMVDKLLVHDVGLRFSCSGYLQGLQAARTLLCDFEVERVALKIDSKMFGSA